MLTCHICGVPLHLWNRSLFTNRCLKCLAVASLEDDNRAFFYFSKLYPEIGPEEIRHCPPGACARAILLSTFIYLGAVALGAWFGDWPWALLMGAVGLPVISYYRVLFCNHLVNIDRKRVYFSTLVAGFWSVFLALWLRALILNAAAPWTLSDASLHRLAPAHWWLAGAAGLLLALAATALTDRSRRERLADGFRAWQLRQATAT